MEELIIPPDAKNASEAIEIFRGWIIDQKLQCSLDPLIFEDDYTIWGILFADAIQHTANALGENSGRESSDIRNEICEVLFRELKSPTDEHSGDYVDKT